MGHSDTSPGYSAALQFNHVMVFPVVKRYLWAIPPTPPSKKKNWWGGDGGHRLEYIF